MATENLKTKEMERKCKEFDNFVQTAKEEIDKEEGRKCEEFGKFISDIESLLSEETKRKYEEFGKFVGAAEKVIKNDYEQKKEEFENFIRNIEKKICEEVESWDEKEKKLFELWVKFEEGGKALNIFEAFGYDESVYRDFLVWLLNKDVPHGLGDRFTKSFVNYIVKKIGEKEFSDAEFRNCEIEKEVPLEGKSIDFIITGASFLCAVEMKLRGRPSKKQLENYEGSLLKEKVFPNVFGICLTLKKPAVEEPFNRLKLFKLMNWWEVALVLVEIYKDVPEDFVKRLIEQFLFKTFFFIENIGDLDESREILNKKRWFEIYKDIKRDKQGG